MRKKKVIMEGRHAVESKVKFLSSITWEALKDDKRSRKQADNVRFASTKQ